jgi:dTDP-4-amino-4,6-dideoxygalactose transaminase
MNSERKRVYLSSPHMGHQELKLVQEAFVSNWIAPLGPHVDAFEREVAEYVGMSHAAALSSGTAAIHLSLRLLDIQPGDEILCSTFTFSASANPIVYEGGSPVFIDSEENTWNMDAGLLQEELRDCARRGKLPKAVIVVDLYGQCADYDSLLEVCAEYEIPLIEDSAEALGASYKGRMAGSFGKFGIFSFNGNKIITTSGGGMLVCNDADMVQQARFLATQARDPAPHFQHSHIGYNYRLSNVLAAIGRGQMQVLEERVAARRSNFRKYQERLASLPGISFMPISNDGEPNYWLTGITVEPRLFGATREDIRLALEQENIESRPLWKPMHLQPVFDGCRIRGGSTAEKVFEQGLCLPSGSNLSQDDLERVVTVIQDVHRRGSIN